MKRTAILLASAAAIVAAPAQAREGQLYAGVNGGVSFEDQVDIDIADVEPQENLAFADTEMGIDADIVFGYDFGAFRIEAEAGYKRNTYDSLTIVNEILDPDAPRGPEDPSFTPFSVENEEDLQIFSGMVNGLIEIGSDDGLQVFGGGGIGIAALDLPVETTGLGVLVDDSST
ncbi:MAG: flagellar motor protein MotB, partial [Erythrobacter sp.]